MFSGWNDPRAVAPVVAEMAGTFLFFFVGMGAVVMGSHTGDGGGGLVGVALAHGLALAVLVSALGPISGGHFNPAVTLGVWITGRIDATRAGVYVAAQLLGGLAAGLALRLVFPESSWEPVALGTPAIGAGISVLSAIVIEAILTMVLLFAVFFRPSIGGRRRSAAWPSVSQWRPTSSWAAL